jgi:hypothetical protein
MHHKREVENRRRRKIERSLRAQALAPSFQSAIRQLATARDGLVLAGSLFRNPDDEVPRVRIDLARRMHRAALVRFSSTRDDTRLHLTDKGQLMAETLRDSH